MIQAAETRPEALTRLVNRLADRGLDPAGMAEHMASEPMRAALARRAPWVSADDLPPGYFTLNCSFRTPLTRLSADLVIRRWAVASVASQLSGPGFRRVAPRLLHHDEQRLGIGSLRPAGSRSEISSVPAAGPAPASGARTPIADEERRTWSFPAAPCDDGGEP